VVAEHGYATLSAVPFKPGFWNGLVTPVCYDLKARTAEPPDACRASNALARRARDISRLVVVDDLQDRLRGEP
jgi:hypothetical protein